MAIYSSIALGTARKSIGNVTMLVLKGQRVAKQKMTSYLDKNTDVQQSNRNQLANAVMAWGIFKGFLNQAVNLPRTVESQYNAFIRLFKKGMEVVRVTFAEAVATIANGSYGSGFPLTIISAVASAAGLTITYAPVEGVHLPTGSIKAMAVKYSGEIYVFTGVVGAGGPYTLVIPTGTIEGADIQFCCLYYFDDISLIPTSGPIQVITTLVA